MIKDYSTYKKTPPLQKDPTLTNVDKSLSFMEWKEATLDKGPSTIKKLKVETAELEFWK